MGTLFLIDYSRRDFLKISLASALGVSYSGWLEAMARTVDPKKRLRSCILLWMNGGPSQTYTFDMKAGTDHGGPFKAIPTAVPGIQISEHLPGIAQHMNDIAIIRSMTSKEGDHGRATYLMRTGYRPQESVQYPTLGSIVAKELGQDGSELPSFVSISPFKFFGASGLGPGFLGPEYAPLTVTGRPGPEAKPSDDLYVDNLAPPGSVDEGSMQNRFEILGFLQSEFGSRYPHPSAKAHRANYERAARMMLSQARTVFDLNNEPDSLRDAYGRNRFGQGCLLARRLVERGVPFVEVTLANVPGNDVAWDTHINNFDMVKLLSQVLDPAWSSLMKDLKSRGLLESTLIVWMGEFGRTPKINPQNGRDHYPAAWTTVLAGGGIKGGQVIGDTGKTGEKVEDRPVPVANFFATICSALSINPKTENTSPEGRPIPVVERGGQPIRDLLADV